MTCPDGSFIWYELMTTDPDAAGAFYKAVVGWTFGEKGEGEMDYRMIGRDDGGFAGGVLALTDDMCKGGAKPVWLGYVHVPDVDAEVEKVLAGGGSVQMPATTLPVGRIAMVADPMGAPYYVMTPVPPPGDPEAKSDVFSVDQPQRVRWNELVTPDDDKAVAWYTGHYGWTQEGAMPMGDLGDYRFLQVGGTGIGAVMRKAPVMPFTGWNFYFGVDDIDRAAAAVGEAGGKLAGEPMEIPGGEFTVHAWDPQGTWFGLVGPRR